MGNLHLVTGYAGKTHVTAADMGSLFEGLIRDGQFVMDAGANFEATVVTNNQIRVRDGELLMQGRHVKLDPGAYVDLTIENGAQGYQRHDLIVARYTKDAESGVEDCSLVVIKGAAVSSGPVDPEHTAGDINAEGALLNDLPLYRVTLSGLNVESLQPLFEPQAPLYTLLSRLDVYEVSGQAAMEAKIDEIYAGMVDCTQKLVQINVAQAGSTIQPASYAVSIYRAYEGYGHVTITTETYGRLFRKRFGSTWDAWEWENPPLWPGVEYRTTERYDGKVVYTKLINYGALGAANTTASISLNTDKANIVDFSIITKIGNNYWNFPTFDLYDAKARLTGYYAPSNRAFVLQCHIDLSAANAVLIAKYTKD